jgi:hypothetical protein
MFGIGPFEGLILGLFCLMVLAGIGAAVVIAIVGSQRSRPSYDEDRCPGCGQMVSKLDTACPECGRPINGAT